MRGAGSGETSKHKTHIKTDEFSGVSSSNGSPPKWTNVHRTRFTFSISLVDILSVCKTSRHSLATVVFISLTKTSGRFKAIHYVFFFFVFFLKLGRFFKASSVTCVLHVKSLKS